MNYLGDFKTSRGVCVSQNPAPFIATENSRKNKEKVKTKETKGIGKCHVYITLQRV